MTPANITLLQSRAHTTALPERFAPFYLHVPGAVWMVTSGFTDIFLVQYRDGESFGARTPVMRVKVGEAIFGVPGDAAGFALLAIPGPGSVIAEVPPAEVWSSNSILPEPGWKAVERWVDALTRAAADRLAPKNTIRLKPEPQTVASGEKGQTVTPEKGMLWVECEQGTARFLSRTPCGAETPFPVSPRGWIETDPKSRLKLRTYDQMPSSLEETLDGFHRTMMALLVENREQAECQRDRQQAARMAADQVGVDTAMRRLSDCVDGDESVPADEENFPDELFQACQAVGRQLGVSMKPHPDMRRGVRLADPVVSIAKASGVRYRRVVLKDTWWTSDHGPILAFRDGTMKAVALLPRRRRRGYEILDPADQSRRVVDAEVAATLTPVAYMFYRPFPSQAIGMKDLLVFAMAPCKSDAIWILLMGVLAGMLGALGPLLSGVIFDSIIPGAQRTQLLYISSFLVVAAISTSLLSMVRGFAMLRMEGRMEGALQAAVWDRLLDLPVPFFREYSSGDLALRGMAISQIRQALTGTTLTSILSGAFSVFSFALLFYYSWRLALLATGLTMVAVLVSGLIAQMQVRYQRTLAGSRGQLTSQVLQFLGGIAKLRVSGTESRAFSRWAHDFSRQKIQSMESQTVSNALTIFNGVYPLFCSGCMFALIGYLLTVPTAPQMSTGDFVAFQAAFLQFLTAALAVTSAVISVLNVVPIYERSAPILRTLPEADATKSSPVDLAGRVEINHLSFRYHPDAPPILRDVSMRIEPGQFVAIVGSSGSGKSTLMRLLLGFEKPGSGSIYFDGQDLANLDVQSLRQKLGVVLQGGRLFTGDIFTNIVGALPLTVDDAWEAAKLAGFDADVRSMPMGMFTVISEGGSTLSGGQRQRLLIARALVKKPRIVLFDEATSALDNETQAIVSKGLDSMNATRIVIAHRLSTIVNADRIYVLDQGRVVQSGTFEELVRQDGVFRDLASRQLV